MLYHSGWIEVYRTADFYEFNDVESAMPEFVLADVGLGRSEHFRQFCLCQARRDPAPGKCVQQQQML